MATTFDIELLLSDIEAFLVANLNTKLAAIDTEKNDGVTLAQINSAAYYQQTIHKETLNYDPFVIYGIEAIEARGQGPATLEKYQLYVVVVMTDTHNDPKLLKRLLRYQRALKELFHANWSTIGNPVKMKVSSLVPVPLALFDDGRISSLIGVSLDIDLNT